MKKAILFGAIGTFVGFVGGFLVGRCMDLPMDETEDDFDDDDNEISCCTFLKNKFCKKKDLSDIEKEEHLDDARSCKERSLKDRTCESIHNDRTCECTHNETSECHKEIMNDIKKTVSEMKEEFDEG